MSFGSHHFHHQHPQHGHVEYYAVERPLGEEYCSNVASVEQTTRITEGPHFPHRAVYKHKEAFEEDDVLAGRAAHHERFQTTCEDVVEDGGLLRRKHYY